MPLNSASLRARGWLVVTAVIACVSATLAQAPESDEDVARRQLESGRAFARQGNFTEALKDFRAVADTHAKSSVADNALLEIARYYLDTVGDMKEASAAVDTILKTYATSDSAPDAYVLAGRLALARSHQPADLDAALANFERVARLFPTSEAVPRSLVLTAETMSYAGRYEEALANVGRVELEYPNDVAAADAHLVAGRVLLSLADPISAMEELQQTRNRWPGTPEATMALQRTTLLHRLYVRAKGGPAFAAATEPVGPAKISGAKALAMTASGALYWASDSAAGVVTPAGAPSAGTGFKPRGLTVDTAGNLVVFEASVLRPIGATPLPLAVPQPNGLPLQLKGADAVVQLSSGDWLVFDDSERGIQRFSRNGTYVGPFSAAKLTRMAVNDIDEVAGLDRDKKNVVLFDATGKTIGTIPFKGTGYDLQSPEDLAYDSFGHLYVLDQRSIAVFSPYPATPSTAPATAALTPGAVVTRKPTYRLVTIFTEPPTNRSGFQKATSFAVDPSGAVYLYDERVERVLVYR